MRLFNFALLPLLFIACGGMENPPEASEPESPLAVFAEPLSLDENNVLTANVTWLARDPYTRHSVYFGTGSLEDRAPDNLWEVDPVVIENITREEGLEPGSREISQLIEVQLFEFDVEGYLCVVAWNRNLFRENCVDVTWPGVPAEPSDIIIDFGDQTPPWQDIVVVPSEFQFPDDWEVGDTIGFVGLLRDYDDRLFLCVNNLDTGLTGFVQVDLREDSLDGIYVSEDYAWYTMFNCDIEWSSSDESVFTVATITPTQSIITRRPNPGQSMFSTFSNVN